MPPTMPRSTAHRASSLRLQWLRGRSLACAGCSQANATIAQICSGVNVAGAPGRGASANRWATGVASAALRQRRCQWRTVFGHTPSWRAIWRTPVPAAASRISRARSASLRGVVWARTRRVSTCSCAGVITIGSADKRGIGASANRGTNRRCAMPRQNTLDSPLTGIPEAMRPVLSPTVAIRTQRLTRNEFAIT